MSYKFMERMMILGWTLAIMFEIAFLYAVSH